MRIEEIEKRIENLEHHIKEHPSDCEAIIAHLKLRSMLIDKARKIQMDARLREVAEIRRRRNEKQRQRNRDGRGYAESDSPTGSDGDSLPDTIQ